MLRARGQDDSRRRTAEVIPLQGSRLRSTSKRELLSSKLLNRLALEPQLPMIMHLRMYSAYFANSRCAVA
jgi:hypothetical protein